MSSSPEFALSILDPITRSDRWRLNTRKPSGVVFIVEPRLICLFKLGYIDRAGALAEFLEECKRLSDWVLMTTG
jgi:hypothetical protein